MLRVPSSAVADGWRSTWGTHHEPWVQLKTYTHTHIRSEQRQHQGAQELVIYSYFDFWVWSGRTDKMLGVHVCQSLDSSVPSWQESPIQLCRQLQRPLRVSHCAPLPHSQVWAQSGPKRFSLQSDAKHKNTPLNQSTQRPMWCEYNRLTFAETLILPRL